MSDSKRNLATAFDENSHDYFLEPADARAKIEEQKKQLSTTSDPFEQMALYGRIGGALRILRELDQAEIFLDEALKLISTHDFSKSHWAQQATRRAHVAHWKGQFDAAEKMLKDVLEECRRNSECKAFEHFALQHLGKCFLDKKDYTSAIKYFEEALSLRKLLNDPQLIKSSEDAIRIAQTNLKN